MALRGLSIGSLTLELILATATFGKWKFSSRIQQGYLRRRLGWSLAWEKYYEFITACRSDRQVTSVQSPMW